MSRRQGFAMALAAVLTASTASLAAAGEPVASFHAVAVNMSNVGRTGADSLDIVIERWTTDAEFAKLSDALLEKGSPSLMSTLQRIKPRVGYIRRSAGGLGWNIQFARKEELPSGGYKVVVATDRPMGFWERANNPRSAQYEFLVAEMRVAADGKGQGQLLPMAKVDFDESSRTLEIEGYATQPIRLTRVTANK
jgi:hypothetical protein